MANTVNILSYNNTFGDLVAQQNLVASELNNLGANNYTKNTGTLYLAGIGTGLSVSNTAILGTAVVSGTTSAVGDVTASANVFVTGPNYALQVSNNAIIAKTLVTNQVIANTIVRTDNSLANNITANNIVRSYVINATGPTYTDSLQANTVVSTPIIIASTSGLFNVLTSNTSITGASLSIGSINASGSVTAGSLSINNTTTTQNLIVTGSFTSPTSGSFTGQATLTGVSTTNTTDTNAANTQIATTAFVKNALNSGNTFNHSISGTASSASYASSAGSASSASYASSAGSASSASYASYASSASSASYASSASTADSANALNTSNNYRMNSLGVGTAASGTSGEIRAINNITAYYSDDNLKTRIGNIENALEKVMSLNGFYYEANETAQALGYTVKREVGVSAQEVQKILPEIVVPAPIDDKYLTVHYDKLIPLLIESIKELKAEVDALKKS